MFTNIPKELVFKVIENRWTEISKAKLTFPQFVYTIDLILGFTCFSFNDRVYEQIYGTPMESPSSILAGIVMTSRLFV